MACRKAPPYSGVMQAWFIEGHQGPFYSSAKWGHISAFPQEAPTPTFTQLAGNTHLRCKWRETS